MSETTTTHKPLLRPDLTNADITDKLATMVLTKHTPLSWFFGAIVGFGLLQFLMLGATWLLYKGTGVWGITIPIGWGFAIVNFVWWVGIGHAGTLISAILLLLHQKWRNSINRFAEAMTLFAVSCAGLFPLLHTGRPWVAYWMFPYPNSMNLWPQFRSPLLWDVFAVTTYATVSALFWFVGLIPDLATMRDRSKYKILKFVYGALALGWRGSARHWQRYESAYLLLAGLATPLVISVHSVVSLDFAVSLVPGWHSTIFPPYFVAGAIYSGFAMVLTLTIPLRKIYGLEEYITDLHIENMAKVMLGTGLIVAFAYLNEVCMAWYSGDIYEMFLTKNRAFGPYAVDFWALILFNILIPQALWFKSVRSSGVKLFIISIVVNIGMWLERYVIIVISLTRDFMPSAWGTYHGTRWDWAILVGSIGLFITSLCFFVRSLPSISISETKMLAAEERAEEGHH